MKKRKAVVDKKNHSKKIQTLDRFFALPNHVFRPTRYLVRLDPQSKSWILVFRVSPEEVARLGSCEKFMEIIPQTPLTISIMGKSIPLPRFSQSFLNNYFFTNQTATATEETPIVVQQWTNYVNKVIYPDLLKSLCSETDAPHEFNQCLGNWYLDGNHYIGPHQDDETDLVSNSPIVSISLGQTRKFRIYRKTIQTPKSKIAPSKTARTSETSETSKTSKTSKTAGIQNSPSGPGRLQNPSGAGRIQNPSGPGRIQDIYESQGWSSVPSGLLWTHEVQPSVTTFDILVENGDIVVMGGAMQRYFKHSVPPIRGAKAKTIGPRVNLTFRILKQKVIQSRGNKERLV